VLRLTINLRMKRPKRGSNKRGSSKSGYFNISEVARILGVSASTLRMWERLGLVSPQRSDGRYRLFTLNDVKHLKQIKFLKSSKNLNNGGVLHLLSQDTPAHLAPAVKRNSSSSSIGQKLRDHRLQQKMTLKDVTDRTGLSIGFLSSLERSQANASVATLQKLAKLYHTNFMTFFDDSEQGPKLVRAGERKVLDAQPGTRIELLALGQTVMESQLWRIAPGASSGGAYSHEGEEFIYVLQGRFEVWLEDVEHYVLRPGDCLYFSSAQPHRWLNPGKTETRLLWVNTPPTF
jgi:DNA-binding transcriptional MerR regulator/quercetin dioxygenase-like cupin family protein